MNDYIVSYCGGSSGRLINAIILYAINYLDQSISITGENSAHIGPDSYSTTIDLPVGYNYREDTYSLMQWNRKEYKYGSLWTHAAPNFDQIRDNPYLSNTKVIFIRVNPPDFVETASNLAFKAYLPTLKKYQSVQDPKERLNLIANSSVMFRRVTATLTTKLGKTVHELDADSTDMLILAKDIILNTAEQHSHFMRFTKLDIPTDFVDRTLILDFSDLKSRIGLDKIKEFIRNDLSMMPKLEKSYYDYVESQRQLIKTVYPWVTTQ